jgi:hypothetical protein
MMGEDGYNVEYIRLQQDLVAITEDSMSYCAAIEGCGLPEPRRR